MQREVAFGKTNLTTNAPGIISRSWTGSLKKMYRQQRGGGGGSGGGSGGGGGGDSFLQLIEMPQNLHADAGAPARAWTRFDFSRNDPGAQINITLSWFNKTRTRLPESHWMDFELSLPKARRTKGRKGSCSGRDSSSSGRQQQRRGDRYEYVRVMAGA